MRDSRAALGIAARYRIMNQVGIGILLGGIVILVAGLGAWWLAVGIIVFGLMLIGAAAEDDEATPLRLKNPEAATRRLGSPNRESPPGESARTSVAAGDDWLEVVGESFFESANRKLRMNETGIQTGTGMLIREPRNTADRNAIGVHLDGVGQVGYLPRDIAASIAGDVDRRGGRHRCGIRYARTSPDRYWSFTVVTDLDQISG